LVRKIFTFYIKDLNVHFQGQRVKSGEFMLKYNGLNFKIMQTIYLIQRKIANEGNAILNKRDVYPYKNIL